MLIFNIITIQIIINFNFYIMIYIDLIVVFIFLIDKLNILSSLI